MDFAAPLFGFNMGFVKRHAVTQFQCHNMVQQMCL